ncbi:MAG: diacylglycerol/lipid kinase family protein [Sphingosinicella sp.]|uniref:diacylglycerol/lipid kinase family protein n=1 Tax=Sphingosinicella sp. TaxID=1917971 RepID=UPI0040377268
MKALLIHHPDAGSGSPSRKALEKAIKAAGWRLDYLERDDADAKALVKAKADLIAIAGGDGTVADTVKILPDRTVPVAIIPIGNANNVARSLGLCAAPERLIADWDAERLIRLDIGEAECPWGKRPFVEGIGFGAFAHSLCVVESCEDETGCPTGVEALRAAVREAEPLPLRIEIDGEELAGEALLVEIMNVPLTGPRLRLAPRARPGGGELCVTTLEPKAREEMLAWLKDPGGDPPVDQHIGRTVRIAGGDVPMRIDDEPCRLETGSEIIVRVQSESVQILAPPDDPALASRVA